MFGIRRGGSDGVISCSGCTLLVSLRVFPDYDTGVVRLTEVQGQVLLSRMAQLLVADIEAVDVLVNLGQVVGAPEAVDEALDLAVVELQVGEHRQIGSERAKHAIVPKMDDSVGV